MTAHTQSAYGQALHDLATGAGRHQLNAGAGGRDHRRHRQEGPDPWLRRAQESSADPQRSPLDEFVAGAATAGSPTDEDATIDQIADVPIRGVLGTVVHRRPLRRGELPFETV